MHFRKRPPQRLQQDGLYSKDKKNIYPPTLSLVLFLSANAPLSPQSLQYPPLDHAVYQLVRGCGGPRNASLRWSTPPIGAPLREDGLRPWTRASPTESCWSPCSSSTACQSVGRRKQKNHTEKGYRASFHANQAKTFDIKYETDWGQSRHITTKGRS